MFSLRGGGAAVHGLILPAQCNEEQCPLTNARIHLFNNLSNFNLFNGNKSHNGTETETPSPALGICEFHQSYF